jgi:hypothetical protein
LIDFGFFLTIRFVFLGRNSTQPNMKGKSSTPIHSKMKGKKIFRKREKGSKGSEYRRYHPFVE